MRTVSLTVLEGIGIVAAGDDIAGAIAAALERAGLTLADGDIIVVAQKIVSKAEGRVLRLSEVAAHPRAEALAAETGKPAALVQAIMDESAEVLRVGSELIVVEHWLGHVIANAGIDQSNVAADAESEGLVLLLPEDPDRSARDIRGRLEDSSGARIGVIVSDSVGRAWRQGTVGMALGVAGPPALLDRRGEPDLFGRHLHVTEVGFADAIAASAVLVMGEGDEGCPAVLVQGLVWTESGQGIGAVLRPRAKDLFR